MCYKTLGGGVRRSRGICCVYHDNRRQRQPVMSCHVLVLIGIVEMLDPAIRWIQKSLLFVCFASPPTHCATLFIFSSEHSKACSIINWSCLWLQGATCSSKFSEKTATHDISKVMPTRPPPFRWNRGIICTLLFLDTRVKAAGTYDDDIIISLNKK